MQVLRAEESNEGMIDEEVLKKDANAEVIHTNEPGGIGLCATGHFLTESRQLSSNAIFN
jgi:hypothetical protein